MIVVWADPGSAIRSSFEAGLLTVRSVENRAQVERLALDLGQGEAEAIALMHELKYDLLLLDDRRARTRARAEGLPIAGAIGILRMARDRGFIRAVIPDVEALRYQGFRVSKALIDEVLREEDGE